MTSDEQLTPEAQQPAAKVPIVSSPVLEDDPAENSTSVPASPSQSEGMTISDAPLPAFPDPDSAEIALDGNDNTPTTVSIFNLPFFVKWQDLKDLVKEVVPSADSVVRAEVSVFDTGTQRPYANGTVIVRGYENALRCFDNLNGYKWHDRKLIVRMPSLADGPMTGGIWPPPIASFPLWASSAQHQSGGGSSAMLQYLGAPYGHVAMGPTATGEYFAGNQGSPTLIGGPAKFGSESTSFSPPYFASQHSHIPHFNQHQANSHYAWSRRSPNSNSGTSSLPPAQPVDKHKVFVGNIPFSSSLDDLNDFVRSRCNITRIEIIMNDEGLSRGFAIAQFAGEEESQQAIEALDGVDFQGRILTVRYDRYPDSKPYGSGSANNSMMGSMPNGDSSPSGNNYIVSAGQPIMGYPTGAFAYHWPGSPVLPNHTSIRSASSSSTGNSSSTSSGNSNIYGPPGSEAHWQPPAGYWPASNGIHGVNPGNGMSAHQMNAAAASFYPQGLSAQFQNISLGGVPRFGYLITSVPAVMGSQATASSMSGQPLYAAHYVRPNSHSISNHESSHESSTPSTDRSQPATAPTDQSPTSFVQPVIVSSNSVVTE
ncbi:uncharacterized protein V1516DRAFT_669847 [Lipomyces oligophaga]|uniref:uncharacterized protein n=1 Tax=Lipomyces oligophaga TaxID=45792 RepID=UPI0034CDD7FB